MHMATYTANYGLHQWEPGDDFLRTDFNADFQKIDTALGGKARVVYGAYVGAGGAGADNPCTITVPFKPVLVAVKGSQFSTYLLVAVRESLIGNTASTSNSYYEAHLTWSEDSLSWYCGNELGQLNTSGETYHYVAVG